MRRLFQFPLEEFGLSFAHHFKRDAQPWIIVTDGEIGVALHDDAPAASSGSSDQVVFAQVGARTKPLQGVFGKPPARPQFQSLAQTDDGRIGPPSDFFDFAVGPLHLGAICIELQSGLNVLNGNIALLVLFVDEGAESKGNG